MCSFNCKANSRNKADTWMTGAEWWRGGQTLFMSMIWPFIKSYLEINTFPFYWSFLKRSNFWTLLSRGFVSLFTRQLNRLLYTYLSVLSTKLYKKTFGIASSFREEKDCISIFHWAFTTIFSSGKRKNVCFSRVLLKPENLPAVFIKSFL